MTCIYGLVAGSFVVTLIWKTMQAVAPAVAVCVINGVYPGAIEIKK